MVMRSALVAFSEDPVERSARLDQDLGGSRDLNLRAREQHLPRGQGHLTSGAHEFAAGSTGAGVRTLPGLAQLVALLNHERLAGVRENVGATASGGVDLDEPLVLQLLEYGIDGARTRTPRVIGSLRQFLDELIAVAGLLLQEDKHGGANVTSTLAAALTAEGSPSEMTTRTSVVVTRTSVVVTRTSATAAAT